jgi:hypothetical protein
MESGTEDEKYTDRDFYFKFFSGQALCLIMKQTSLFWVYPDFPALSISGNHFTQ